MKKIACVITARGGSKGVPKKNIKDLNGKPLIAYTIEAALNSGVVDKVIVSTDSKEIAAVAESYGAEVPFLRPEHLATDGAKSIDVILHAVEWLENNDQKYEYVLLLQPTSPLRNSQDIANACNLIIENDYDSIISVMEAPHNPDTYFVLENGLINEQSIRKVAHVNRQTQETYYKINGAIYCVNWEQLKKHKTWYLANTLAYTMPKERSVDVDDLLDFELVELLLQKA